MGEQVTITTMYLTGDAKLWWRTRTSDDAAAGRPKIESWEILKKELKDQFLPMNNVDGEGVSEETEADGLSQRLCERV